MKRSHFAVTLPLTCRTSPILRSAWVLEDGLPEGLDLLIHVFTLATLHISIMIGMVHCDGAVIVYMHAEPG